MPGTLRSPLRRSVPFGLALVVATAAAACGGSGGQAGSTTTIPTLGSHGSSAPATAGTAPTTVPVPSDPTSTHVDAADRLFKAWQAHNRPDALKVATPEAVDALFAQDPAGWYEYTYGNELGTFCDTGEFDQGTCNYRDDNDHYAKVQLSHDQRGWIVDSVVISSNEGAG